MAADRLEFVKALRDVQATTKETFDLSDAGKFQSQLLEVCWARIQASLAADDLVEVSKWAGAGSAIQGSTSWAGADVGFLEAGKTNGLQGIIDYLDPSCPLVECPGTVLQQQSARRRMRLLSAAAAAPKQSWNQSQGDDAYFIDRNWIGVADGVGSCPLSGQYSRQLMSLCQTMLADEPGAKDEDKGLLKLIARANKRTVVASSSTVVLAGGLGDGNNMLHIANMGDSACLVIRNGRLLARTTVQVHSANCPYQVCNEKDTAARHLGRCTDLGQVLKVPVQLGDVVVCATDGLWDNVTVEQVVLVSGTVVREGACPQTLAQILMILSKNGWKPDDTTIVASLVVDHETIQMSDEHVWVGKFVRFAPHLALQFGHPYDANLQCMLKKMFKLKDEIRSLDDGAFKSWLAVQLKEMYEEEKNRATGRYIPHKKLDPLDLALPAEVKQVLDDYVCGRLKLPKFKDTELVSCGNGKPSLLLSHLPDIDSGKLESILEENRLVMLAGGHGSGKTKLLYSYLCSRKQGGGLYITARRAEEHWGSADLDYLINEVLSSVVKPTRPHGRRAGYNCRNAGFESHYGVVTRLKLLLAARMKIYDYCKDKMSNTQWLVLQAACRALVNSDGVCVGEAGDVFKAFLAHLCKQDELCQRDGFLNVETICVIDDIEHCRMALHGCFTEGGDCVGLGFDRALRDFFEKAGSRVVFSGASIQKKLPQVFANGCWKNADEAIQYIEQVLQYKLSKDEADFARTCVFERLKGRFTPIVTMLEVMLAKNLDLRNAAEYIEKGYTTEEGVPEVTTSFCRSIASSSQVCQAFIGWSSFEQSVFGEKPPVLEYGRSLDKLVNELFESGLSRLDKDETTCDEYLVLKAYENMHGTMSVSWMHPVVADKALPLGADSIVKYDLVPFCMVRMWKEYKGVLQEMPVFKELLQADDCPLQLKSLSKSQSAFVVKDGSHVSSGVKLDQFFSAEQAPNSTTFQCWSAEDYSSSSAAGRMAFDCVPGTRVGYLHHVHHPENAMHWYWTKCALLDAKLVETEPGVDWAEQQVIPDVLFCFVIFHPLQSLEGLPYKWSFKEVAPGKLKITVVLGMENMDLVFTEGEMDILAEISNEHAYVFSNNQQAKRQRSLQIL